MWTKNNVDYQKALIALKAQSGNAFALFVYTKKKGDVRVPRKATAPNTIREKTIAAMSSLNIYKPEYDGVIDTYSTLLSQFVQVNDRITIYDYAERTKMAMSAESLRKDLLSYAAQLGLTPASFHKISGENVKGAGVKSVLELSLENFSKKIK